MKVNDLNKIDKENKVLFKPSKIAIISLS